MGVVSLEGEARPGVTYTPATGLVVGAGCAVWELQELAKEDGLLSALPAFVRGLVEEEEPVNQDDEVENQDWA